MKTIDEILAEWYPTIPDEEHNGLYARDKVKLIAQEFADQFRQSTVISSVCECKVCGKKYVVKDFETQTYYCGETYGWSKEAYLADYFDTVKDAKRFIKQENGKFQIELVYVV